MSEVNPIVIKDHENNKEYTLEFNRASVKYAESCGFDIQKVSNTDHIVTGVTDLFYFSFRMHHRDMTHADTDALLDRLGGIHPDVLTRLVELYTVPIVSLVNEDEERKNPQMTVEM